MLFCMTCCWGLPDSVVIHSVHGLLQVRMRQVMSVMESQWSNASIVVVSPGAGLFDRQAAAHIDCCPQFVDVGAFVAIRSKLKQQRPVVRADSDNLSVLQAAATGADLRNHRQFAFAPGEARPLQLAAELPATTASARFSCPHPPTCV
jgi:hypothetical protein